MWKFTHQRKYGWPFIAHTIFYGFSAFFIYHVYRLSPPHVPSFHPQSLIHLTEIPPFNENVYAVFINSLDMHQLAYFIEDKKGDLWVKADDAASWNLIAPIGNSRIYEGEKYYLLKNAYPGVSYKIDTLDQKINLSVPNKLFPINNIHANASAISKVPPPDSVGLFLNYNLEDTRSVGASPNNEFSGFFQLGLYSPYGVGTTSFINQNASNTESLLRLLSTWRYDKPEDMWTLSIGDDVSTPTNWSGAVNFAGVQWGRNFSTEPSFITFPQPTFQGQATVPSAINLYINNVLNTHEEIPPGPFVINNIPYVTGQGQVQVVLTDIQGHQQLVNLTFYASNTLLKTGLTNYSYELGTIRQNLGQTSFDYARYLLAATHAVGVNDDLTTQWHIEALSDQETLGFAIFKKLSTFGILNASIASSYMHAGHIINTEDNVSYNTAKKIGGLLQLGFQRQTRHYSFGANTQVTTFYFTEQGLSPGQPAPRLINQIFGGFSIGPNNLGLNYLRQINRFQPGIDLLSGTYSRNIFLNIALSISGVTNLGGLKNKGILLNLTRSLGESTSGSLTNSTQNGDHAEALEIIRSLPMGPGYGYVLQGTTGSATNSKFGSLSLQSNEGTYTGSVSQFNGLTTYGINVQGAAILIKGKTFLTRILNNTSFALVQIPGFKDIDVYLNNQVSSRTDEKGDALVTNLFPYVSQTIEINPNQLPFNAEINEFKKSVIPYYESGAVVPFNIKLTRNATFIVKQTSGEFVPEGSIITLSGKSEESIVGSDGEVYLSNIEDNNQLNFVWGEHQCQLNLSVPLPDKNNPVPDLGVLVCPELRQENQKNKGSS